MQKHTIKNVVFDLRFPSKATLLRENYYLGKYVKHSMVPVVDTVLCGHDRDDSVIFIDKLIVDLGRLRFSDYKSQLPRRLQAELDRILRTKIRHLQKASNSCERIVPLPKHNLELIENFLMTGTLPASETLKRDWSLNRCLQQILDKEQTAFLRFLTRNSRQPQVIQRLVRQFPESAVRQIVRLIASAQSEKAFKAVDHIQQRVRWRSSTNRQIPAFTKLIWELFLEYLLQKPDSRFTSSKFFNWIARKAQSHLVPAADPTMTALIEVGRELLPPEKHAAASKLSPESIASNTAKRRIIRGYDLYEALQFYGRHGKIPWSTEMILPEISVTKIIKTLRKSHPAMLVKFAKDLEFRPDLCQSLAEKLAPKAMREFISALLSVTSGGNRQYRKTFIQSITRFADRAADPKVYYGKILQNLVSHRPIDLKQIVTRSAIPQQSAPQPLVIEKALDPDLIRTHLSAMLKAAETTDIDGLTFLQILEDLEKRYSVEYREYLTWLAADKKRFASFLQLIGSKNLKKKLADLAGFATAGPIIEILEKGFSREAKSVSSNRNEILRMLTQVIAPTMFSRADVFLKSAFGRLTAFDRGYRSTRRTLEVLEAVQTEAQIGPNEKIVLQLKELQAVYQQQDEIKIEAHEPPDSNLPGEKSTKDDLIALMRYLTGDPASPVISETTAKVIFKRLIRQGSNSLYASLLENIQHKGAIEKLIMLLSENLLTRVLAGLWPNFHLAVQTYAEVISIACYSEEILKPPAEIGRLKWKFVFSYLAENWDRPFDDSDFIRRFISFLANKANKSEASTITAILAANLTAHTQFYNRYENDAARRVLQIIEVDVPFSREPAAIPSDEGIKDLRPLTNALAHATDSESAETLKIEHPASLRESLDDLIDELVVENAGMVIAAPYLPRLWNMLGLLKGKEFKDEQTAERALHLLQFMTNENTESLEYHLVLNKILCGFELGQPITMRIEITHEERKVIEDMIQAMIENWKTIGQTSVKGFRESFFQRKGRLRLLDDAWHLKVEQRAFDMLLDSIPWGFSTIKHPWMERVVYVKWR